MQYDYSTVLEKNFQFYNAERLGQLPPDNGIPWRANSLLYEIGPAGLGFGNVTGGWMGGGNAGTVKNTIPTAMSVSMMAWGLLEFPQVGVLLCTAKSVSIEWALRTHCVSKELLKCLNTSGQIVRRWLTGGYCLSRHDITCV